MQIDAAGASRLILCVSIGRTNDIMSLRTNLNKDVFQLLAHTQLLMALAVVVFPSILLGKGDRDLEVLKTVYEDFQATRSNYGQGSGTAKVIRERVGEVQDKTHVEFKYKDLSSRYDTYTINEKNTKKLKLKTVFTPQVDMYCDADAGVLQKPVIAVEEMFGKNMHPSIFNSFYGQSLDSWIKGTLKAGLEGRAIVSVEVDDLGRVHLTETMLHKDDSKSTVAELLIHTKDGYRIVSATCKSEAKTSGVRDFRTYNVDWVQYEGQWYVKSARYEADVKYLDDGDIDSVPVLRSSKVSRLVEIVKYVPNDKIEDLEFTLAGIASQGIYVRDKITGLAYVYGNETEVPK
jgi:hypothetical protein